jgi:signal transduction histidine kinase
MVTHDLRSPLTSIRGLAQLMQRRGTHRPDLVQQIIEQSDRMQALLADLLDVERMEAGQLPMARTAVDLAAVVGACVRRAIALGSGHAIEFAAPDEPVVGWWDRQRLEQIAENLLANALKYTPKGGHERVSVRRSDGFAILSVRDTGIGMPPEALPHVFDRFYRVDHDGSRSPSGIGLGLYITRMLVEAKGGTITVASEPGLGSEFTVQLPIRSVPERPPSRRRR